MAFPHWPPQASDPFATLPTELPEFMKPFASPWHRLQVEWLIESVDARWAERTDFHCDGHTPVYYAARPDRTAVAVVPDFYAVRDVERKPRKVWAIWEDGHRPDVAVEILDENLDREQLREKVRVYEKCMRLSEYFFFDRRSNEVIGFTIGRPYRRNAAAASGRVWSETLDAWLGPWAGHHYDVDATWLRLFDSPNP